MKVNEEEVHIIMMRAIQSVENLISVKAIITTFD